MAQRRGEDGAKARRGNGGAVGNSSGVGAPSTGGASGRSSRFLVAAAASSRSAAMRAASTCASFARASALRSSASSWDALLSAASARSFARLRASAAPSASASARAAEPRRARTPPAKAFMVSRSSDFTASRRSSAASCNCPTPERRARAVRGNGLAGPTVPSAGPAGRPAAPGAPCVCGDSDATAATRRTGCGACAGAGAARAAAGAAVAPGRFTTRTRRTGGAPCAATTAAGLACVGGSGGEGRAGDAFPAASGTMSAEWRAEPRRDGLLGNATALARPAAGFAGLLAPLRFSGPYSAKAASMLFRARSRPEPAREREAGLSPVAPESPSANRDKRSLACARRRIAPS